MNKEMQDWKNELIDHIEVGKNKAKKDLEFYAAFEEAIDLDYKSSDLVKLGLMYGKVIRIFYEPIGAK